jgi:hypothetical protein
LRPTVHHHHASDYGYFHITKPLEARRRPDVLRAAFFFSTQLS